MHAGVQPSEGNLLRRWWLNSFRKNGCFRDSGFSITVTVYPGGIEDFLGRCGIAANGAVMLWRQMFNSITSNSAHGTAQIATCLNLDLSSVQTHNVINQMHPTRVVDTPEDTGLFPFWERKLTNRKVHTIIITFEATLFAAGIYFSNSHGELRSEDLDVTCFIITSSFDREMRYKGLYYQ